jgi:hypothetical protein
VDAALWLTAWSTLLLFLAAVAAGFIAWRTFRAERERDRRAQAVQIGAWTATRGKVQGPQREGTFGLCLLNDSSLPVTDFVVRVPQPKHPEKETDNQRYLVLPPGLYFAPSAGLVGDRYGHFERPIPMPRGTLELQPTTVHADSANVQWFSFVDATGKRWTRWLRAKTGDASLTPGGPPNGEPSSPAQTAG